MEILINSELVHAAWMCSAFPRPQKSRLRAQEHPRNQCCFYRLEKIFSYHHVCLFSGECVADQNPDWNQILNRSVQCVDLFDAFRHEVRIILVCSLEEIFSFSMTSCVCVDQCRPVFQDFWSYKGICILPSFKWAVSKAVSNPWKLFSVCLYPTP